MLEDPQWVEIYIKDGWKKTYKRFLLEKEEFGHLPRWVEGLKELQPHVDNLTSISGVTEAERRTVEKEELGISLPSGMGEVAIPQFPTPKRIIGKIKDLERKQMLTRLYNDYAYLSTYIHGLPDAVILKQGFGKYKGHFSSKQHEDVFQKEVVQPSLFFSLFAVLQAASELISLYHNDIDLRATVTEVWNLLSDHSLLGKVFWEIRAKRLLGSI